MWESRHLALKHGAFQDIPAVSGDMNLSVYLILNLTTRGKNQDLCCAESWQPNPRHLITLLQRAFRQGASNAGNYFRKAVEATSPCHLNLPSLLQFSISIVESKWIVCFKEQARKCRKEILIMLDWAALSLHK